MNEDNSNNSIPTSLNDNTVNNNNTTNGIQSIFNNGNTTHSNGNVVKRTIFSPPINGNVNINGLNGFHTSNGRLIKPRKSKLKARRLRKRMENHAMRMNGKKEEKINEHRRKIRNHNQNFKKMTQKLKQLTRNETCPKLKPLSKTEINLIEKTVSLVINY